MNARQRRWSEFLSEYDFGISYVKGKENVVADALSRRPRIFSLIPIKVDLRQRVLEQLIRDSWYLKVRSSLDSKRSKKPKFDGYELEDDGILRFHGRIYISDNGDLQDTILKEAHRAVYCAHPGVKKMYVDTKKLLFWTGMKCDIVQFVVKCLECQEVNVDHCHLASLLQPHDIHMTKWEIISMDFIIGLHFTSQRHNAILVVVDKLTKSAHFILIRDTYKVADVARVINEIIRFHGIPKKIISDRDSRFTSRFWTSMQSTLGTQLNLSTIYHSKTDGQTEKVNQVLEDMLRMYVMD